LHAAGFIPAVCWPFRTNDPYEKVEAMSSKKITVSLYLNEACGAHLLWNHLCANNGDDRDNATLALLKLSQGTVRDIVRRAIVTHGENSVDCGPHEDYGSEVIEQYAKDLVRRSFGF
jgi:hypothetical protein